MALELTQIQAATNDYFKNKQVYDNYFKSHVLLHMLMSGGKWQKNIVQPKDYADGGQKIRVFLEYNIANTGTYGNTTLIAQSKVDILNAARFSWGGAYTSNAIDLNERIQNTGDAAMVDLTAAKIKNMQMSIRDYMGTGVYATHASTDDIYGLGDLFNATTSTAYGTIAADDMAVWAPGTTASGSTMIFSTLQAMRRAASVGQSTEDKPNLYITTETLRDAYENTLQTQARYKDQTLVDAGFTNVLFGTAPVVADDKQTSGYCDALNLRFLKLMTHKDFAFTKPVWEYNKEQPDVWVANVRWIGQLTCSQRRAHVRYTSLTAAS